ncbi:MAG: cell division protein FtsK [Desulfobulbus propionicus]|nr:MAG: cell division protein FtsK [Desulfobulbus propionicus]
MVVQNPSARRLRNELAAIALIFTALFLLLCLISYARPLLADPPGLQEPAANACGVFGFFLAHYLYSFLGLSAFVPVLIILYAGCTSFLPWGRLTGLPASMAGITGLMFSIAALLASTGELLLPSRFIQPGGHLGALLWEGLCAALGSIGSVLVLVLVLICSLMAAVRFSPLASVHWFWRLVTKLFLKVKHLLSVLVPAGTPDSQTPAPLRAARLEGRAEAEDTLPRQLPAVHEPVPQPPQKTGNEEEFKAQLLKSGDYQLPSLTLLDENRTAEIKVDREHYYTVSTILVNKLKDFGVEGTVEGISPGPVVTTYEFAPAPGVKINKVASLADDLAMVLKVNRVRIVGSIPGKAALGIEIPNPERQTVFLRDILYSPDYQKAKTQLTLGLGFDVIGRPVVADLAKMPHLLIAGATGAGKSVAINAFIASILFKATPDEVRLLMIDPKRIELSVYEDIPHLLHPVVVEPKMASRALLWAVREMERRYRLLEEKRVKSFASYNQIAEEKLPYVVIIVDELADLMMVASKDVETSIARLAQMARAAGMHIILATQRPSVDVLTGLIKANFPTRISFKVSSKIDSRTILDGSGAEHLLGMGDMLFLPPGAAKLQRIHGAYISEQETERIVTFLKEQGNAEYDTTVLEQVETEGPTDDGDAEAYDEKYDEAVAVVTETGQASISMVQRRLRVGYNRAARMIELMEKEGIVGPADGARPREVLVRGAYDE